MEFRVKRAEIQALEKQNIFKNMILDLHLHAQGQREWEARWYYGFMDATGETWYKSILGWLQSVTHVGQALLGMKAS